MSLRILRVRSVKCTEDNQMVVTHNGNLPTKLVLDLAGLDSIWRMLIDDLEQFYNRSAEVLQSQHMGNTDV